MAFGNRQEAIAMTIGGSIALIAIGAILRWAISWSPSHVNMPLIGAILMICGIVALIISLAFMFSRRRRVPPAAPPAEVYEQRRYTDAPGRYTDPPL
jgi:fluoride ion exporter CrcB/FEX